MFSVATKFVMSARIILRILFFYLLFIIELIIGGTWLTGVKPEVFLYGTESLKFGLNCTIDGKNPRKVGFSPHNEGLTCSNGGYSPQALP